MDGDRLETKGIMTSGDHREWHRRAIWFGMHVFGLKPRAQPGIEDFRLALPEVGIQSALDIDMIELQLDGGGVFLKVAPHVGFANVKPGNSAAFGVSFDNHRHLLFNVGRLRTRESGKGHRYWRREPQCGGTHYEIRQPEDPN
jgi:hypothetical protein